MNSAYDVIWNRDLCINKRAYDLWERYGGDSDKNWYSAEREVLSTPLFIILTDEDNCSYLNKKHTAEDIVYTDKGSMIKNNPIIISSRRLSNPCDLYVIGIIEK